MKCSVANCKNNNEGGASICSFFRFPKDQAIRKKWISFCSRKIPNPNTSYVCMHHFKREDFENNLKFEMGFAKRRLLKDGAIPTINPVIIKHAELYEQRAKRIKKRENKKIVDLILKSQCNQENNVTEENNTSILQPFEFIDAAIEEIDIKVENIDEIKSHQSEHQNQEDLSDPEKIKLKVESLKKEIHFLRKEKEINEEALKTMQEKIKNMDKFYKKEKREIEKCLHKTKFELAFVEEKLQVFFTEEQIRKLKNGIKDQTWSEDDIFKSLDLYSLSQKIYKIMVRSNYPLPPLHKVQQYVKPASH